MVCCGQPSAPGADGSEVTHMQLVPPRSVSFFEIPIRARRFFCKEIFAVMTWQFTQDLLRREIELKQQNDEAEARRKVLK